MPYSQDQDRLTLDPINYPMTPISDLSNVGSAQLGQDAATFGQFGKVSHSIEDAFGPLGRNSRTVSCDVLRFLSDFGKGEG